MHTANSRNNRQTKSSTFLNFQCAPRYVHHYEVPYYYLVAIPVNFAQKLSYILKSLHGILSMFFSRKEFQNIFNKSKNFIKRLFISIVVYLRNIIISSLSSLFPLLKRAKTFIFFFSSLSEIMRIFYHFLSFSHIILTILSYCNFFYVY